MKINWAALQVEFDHWQDADLTLPLWWRDDDAIEPSVNLDRLKQISDAHDIPAHLAIIPKYATPELVDFIAASQNIIPTVHGWAHISHAPIDHKKAEFGATRQAKDSIADAKMGLERLRALFGTTLKTMFVPPWNRIDPNLASRLADLGYTTLSTYTPRIDTYAAPNLMQINTHLDPIAWRSDRSVVDPDILVAEMVKLMQDRRLGYTDNSEPLGLLTHHLVHDAAIWGFIEQFFTFMLSGPVRPFRI